MQRILVVEDEIKVANAVKKGLEENGFEVDVAYDGRMGKSLGASNNYDLVILDLNLPHANGYEVCEVIRRRNNRIPIIMLTALGGMEDKMQAFELGADDYLVKPFDFRELLARIRVFLKRAGSESQQNSQYKIVIADLEIDREKKEVTRSGKKIPLTAKEYQLLEFLALHKGKVISKLVIAEKVWDIDFDTGTNVIEVYMNFLRKKIDKDFDNKLLHTKTGMGYYLAEE
ncbi:response regulator transcription factor [Chitinophaga sancti]|uniref:DNA-binding response regulator, OmpR family, contains REC and winged-helix (WHTH) domain n=1 Tax=Chitinophaga sancti TaxID=1004 RepID=A0A1K1N8F2_9BACT|nr:response regulator transcription factor [Chitinophaga sancti]WQD63456.1 response regulator transcription factor [Chitinophaga sancti]WQG90918.1 response regulator transcription factor [Chitinophaga sancti]SFW31720.1 DNA-binding response regulator, OmpR family, contains REC and winged-helix (wHTH) domain [Chitinophaga sancti]